jgi:hypothetical protein
MGNAIPQWSIDVTNRLLATYVSPDRRLLDVEGFKAAKVRTSPWRGVGICFRPDGSPPP